MFTCKRYSLYCKQENLWILKEYAKFIIIFNIWNINKCSMLYKKNEKVLKYINEYVHIFMNIYYNFEKL